MRFDYLLNELLTLNQLPIQELRIERVVDLVEAERRLDKCMESLSEPIAQVQLVGRELLVLIQQPHFDYDLDDVVENCFSLLFALGELFDQLVEIVQDAARQFVDEDLGN